MSLDFVLNINPLGELTVVANSSFHLGKQSTRIYSRKHFDLLKKFHARLWSGPFYFPVKTCNAEKLSPKEKHVIVLFCFKVRNNDV